VYLSDVLSKSSQDDIETFHEEFKTSRWFTRGWCLQELIAPGNVQFFNASWQHIGSKLSLAKQITLATGIRDEHLFPANLLSIPISTRMSWAGKRKTTRIEDIAYCLFGIFDIHMPLLYGEGERAFIRLQEEILKESSDQSIFLWKPNDVGGTLTHSHQRGLGALAKHPSAFLEYANVVSSTPSRSGDFHEVTTVTNRGIRMQLPLTTTNQQYIAWLSCRKSKSGLRAGLPVIKLETTDELVLSHVPFTRTYSHPIWSRGDVVVGERRTEIQTIYLAKTDTSIKPKYETLVRCHIRSMEMTGAVYQLVAAVPYRGWDWNRRSWNLPADAYHMQPNCRVPGSALAFASRNGERFALLLQFDNLGQKDFKAGLQLRNMEQPATAPPASLSKQLYRLLDSTESVLTTDSLGLGPQEIKAMVTVSLDRLTIHIDITICPKE
jgi:hypothetical protein